MGETPASAAVRSMSTRTEDARATVRDGEPPKRPRNAHLSRGCVVEDEIASRRLSRYAQLSGSSFRHRQSGDGAVYDLEKMAQGTVHELPDQVPPMTSVH